MFLAPYVDNEANTKLPVRVGKLVSPNALTINAISCNSAQRAITEAFVKKGYYLAYQANISVTTPYLLSLQKGKLKSALGVRSAKESLFTEQYIDISIEKKLAVMGLQVEREKIAEIAHLYSNAKVFTLPLLLVTALALNFKNYETMVFTGTQHVIQMIEKIGIKVHTIAKACPSKLAQSQDNWGSYYDTNPQVAFIRLSNVVQIIEASPKLSTMFNELTPQIVNVVSQLADL